MELQKGDWVRTPKGVVGQIVLISNLSASIEVDKDGRGPRVFEYVLSYLTKIDPLASKRNSPK